MRIPYGYTRSETNQIVINQQQASVVKAIYDLYLRGKSLGGIANALKAQNILSPTGNPIWTRAAIDKLLSNGRYVPYIISEEQFWKSQLEKERRTNMDDDSRKTARYNSQNVLSGLLVCDECGCNYRRITRPSGELVWRCADKVENGKHATCSNLTTVSNDEIKNAICDQLGIEVFDDEIVRNMVDTVNIGKEGIVIRVKSSPSIGMMIL